jgi:hypothetical protein
MQERGPARHVPLDRRNQRIDVRSERRGVVGKPRARIVAGHVQLLAELAPVRLDQRELLARRVVPRHRQRPFGVTVAQQRNRAVEFVGERGQAGVVAHRDRERPAVRLHSHASRFVDRGGTAVELPRHPQRDRDRRKGEQHERRRDDRERPAERAKPVLSHCRILGRPGVDGLMVIKPVL